MNVSFARKRRLVRNKLKSPFTHIKKGKSCAFQLSRMKKETFSFALPRKKRKKNLFSRTSRRWGIFSGGGTLQWKRISREEKSCMGTSAHPSHCCTRRERDTPLTSPRNAYMILLFPRAMLYLPRASLHITLWHTILSPPLSVLLLLLSYPHRFEHVWGEAPPPSFPLSTRGRWTHLIPTYVSPTCECGTEEYHEIDEFK